MKKKSKYIRYAQSQIFAKHVIDVHMIYFT